MVNYDLRSSIEFFGEFFRHFRQLGTPFQSSSYLVEAVVREVVGDKIVELGAGNGPMTRGILHAYPDSRVTAFEINPKLLENLSKIRDPRLTIVDKSAEDFVDYVNEFDCVVCGLPLTSLPDIVVDKVLNSSRKARKFIQYKYFPTGRLLKKYFNDVMSMTVWRNIPPAQVYICTNREINP